MFYPGCANMLILSIFSSNKLLKLELRTVSMQNQDIVKSGEKFWKLGNRLLIFKSKQLTIKEELFRDGGEFSGEWLPDKVRQIANFCPVIACNLSLEGKP